MQVLGLQKLLLPLRFEEIISPDCPRRPARRGVASTGPNSSARSVLAADKVAVVVNYPSTESAMSSHIPQMLEGEVVRSDRVRRCAHVNVRRCGRIVCGLERLVFRRRRGRQRGEVILYIRT